MEMATGNYVINHMNFENKNVELYMSLFHGRQDEGFTHNAFASGQRLKNGLRKPFGWGGRIRTLEWWDQNPLPYHLATPQRIARFPIRSGAKASSVRLWQSGGKLSRNL